MKLDKTKILHPNYINKYQILHSHLRQSGIDRKILSGSHHQIQIIQLAIIRLPKVFAFELFAANRYICTVMHGDTAAMRGQKLKNRLNSLIYIGLTFGRKHLYPHFRSLFPCLFFVACSVQKEENQLYIIVLQRFVRKPPVVTENIFLQTLGNTFENKAQKQGDLSAPLPILHIIHYTSAFYTTINLSYRHFVNPKNFNVMRQETFAILFLMQKGGLKKKSIYLQSYRKIISL